MVGDNINWPLYAIGRKLEEVVAVIRQGGVDWPHFYKSTPLHALLTIVATLTQCLYLLTHREWKNRLWRVGLVFVPLFLCVAYQVWYSHFTVTRHALPITLAFNLLLAARPNRRWLIWFIMGNCFVPYGIYKFVCFGLETSHPAEFTVSAALPPGVDIDVSFGAGWTGVEWDSQRSWRWATGPRATLLLANGGRSTLEVELAGNVLGAAPHDLSVSTPGANLWQGRLEAQPVPLHTRKFTVPPGIIVVTFEIAPPEAEANARSFRISDLSAVVTPSR
jgi:hypothetical protein